MKYILKRVGMAIITLLVVSIIVFFMFQIIPGDVVSTKLGTNATEERIEELRELYGLNKPIFVRYIDWVKGMLQGDMGISYSKDIPVSDLVGNNIVVTLTLALLSLGIIILFGMIIGIGLGYLASKKTKKATIFSDISDTINQVFMAIPSFYIGIIISIIFGLTLKWFVPGKYTSHNEDFIAFIICLIPAAVAVSIPKIAMLVRFVKNAVCEEMNKDYVRTAKSKGLSDVAILSKHVMKNSIVTSVTALSVIMAEIFAGSVVVEQVFNLPGLSKLLITSIGNRDYPVVMAIVMYIAVVIIAINLIVDIIYKLVDPRIGGQYE